MIYIPNTLLSKTIHTMWKIYFLLWVSGAGKTTLFQELEKIDQDRFIYIPSYTTRDTRPWEVNGVKYWHISHEEFEQGIANWEFMERAHSTNIWTYYGTKYEDMIAPTREDKNTIKEIEPVWLEKVIQEGKVNDQMVSIFLDIDDEKIKERLTMRGSQDEIPNRVARAQMERDMARKYCDHFIDASRPLEEVKKDFFELLGIW